MTSCDAYLDGKTEMLSVHRTSLGPLCQGLSLDLGHLTQAGPLHYTTAIIINFNVLSLGLGGQ